MKSGGVRGKERLIIFGRIPKPGKSKTRLIPAMGPAGAADFQRRLTERVLREARMLSNRRGSQVVFCFSNGNTKMAQKWVGQGVDCIPQQAGDLGQRMHAAFSDAFENGCERVVLVGTDIPALSEEIFDKAFSMLKDRDAVLNPTKDGGYCLIGMRRLFDLFSGIVWSREDVSEATCRKAKTIGLGYALLEPLSDVDTPEDLERLPDGLCSRSTPYLSVVIPALDEADTVAAAIRSARDPDTEILVVDGGSTDDTVRRAEAEGVRVITSPSGRAGQQNRGAAAAAGRILLFLHADSILPPGYVGEVYDTFMDPKVVAGAFRFRTDYRRPLMRIVEGAANLRSRLLKLPYGDQGLFVPRDIFNRLGRFPDVAIAEDFILVRRLARHGKIHIARGEVVTSGRRWRRIGIVRTFWINFLIVAGHYLGVPNERLSRIYRSPKRERSPVSKKGGGR